MKSEMLRAGFRPHSAAVLIPVEPDATEMKRAGTFGKVSDIIKPFCIKQKLDHYTFMKIILGVGLLTLLSACSTPNANPTATAAAYEQIKVGMTRAQVYALLGPPKTVQPTGPTEVARWGIPHDRHGWGTSKVTFENDKVTKVSSNHATAPGLGSHRAASPPEP